MTTRKNAQEKIAGMKVASVSSHEPLRSEEIRERAYMIYVQRGRTDGFELEDWLRAEGELKQSLNRATDQGNA
jgi:hypothetical protein